MKIAIVSTYFLFGSNYLEEILADELEEMGHDVHVFASTLRPKEFIVAKNFKKYQVNFFKVKFKIGSNVWTNNISSIINDFQPEKIIVMGGCSPFSAGLYNSEFANRYKIYTFIGLNSFMNRWGKNKSITKKIENFVTNDLFKYRYYKNTVKYSTKLVLYTPETFSILKDFLTKKETKLLEDKKIETCLGYNERKFYFDASLRLSKRDKYQVKDEKLVIHASRLDKSKKVEKIVDALVQIHETSQYNFFLILAGFQKDNYKNEVEKYITEKGIKFKYLLLDFVDNKEQNALFCAADVAIYQKVGASIQQALATGVQVILPDSKATKHLLLNANHGTFISSDLGRDILSCISKDVDRFDLSANFKAVFSNSILIKDYLEL